MITLIDQTNRKLTLDQSGFSSAKWQIQLLKDTLATKILKPSLRRRAFNSSEALLHVFPQIWGVNYSPIGNPYVAQALKPAIAFIIFTWFCISINEMLIKYLSDYYPLHEMVFVRSVIGIVISLILVQLEGVWRILKPYRPGLHFFARADVGDGQYVVFYIDNSLATGKRFGNFFSYRQC